MPECYHSQWLPHGASSGAPPPRTLRMLPRPLLVKHVVAKEPVALALQGSL